MMKHFRFYSKADILSLTRVRKYETRFGERIQFVPTANNWQGLLAASNAKFVLFGIPEDIGVKGNLGIGGADTNWLPFLNTFLNYQNNAFMDAADILLLGHFDFGDVKYLIENAAYNAEERIDAYRHAIRLIDDEVETVAKAIVAAGKLPIAIGGGHNNAYPLIKGVAKALFKRGEIPLAKINCINLDAHADYKFTEGRHSGNAFRYAEADGFLGKYCALGVHESSIAQNMLADMEENPAIQYITFEDIFIRERISFRKAIAHAAGFTAGNKTGIEIDLDVIEDTLSSADTPSGISTIQARQFAYLFGTSARSAYLHICEGASQLVNGRKDENTGKLISFLVADFLKGGLE